MKTRTWPIVLGVILLRLLAASPPAASTATTSSVAPEPSGPREAVSLLLWCWQTRDIARYRELFTADYRFTSEGLPAPLTRPDELGSAEHLFVGGGPAPAPSIVALQFGNEHLLVPDYRPGKAHPWHQVVVVRPLSLQVGETADALLSAHGQAVFFMVRGDSAAIPEDLVAGGAGPDSTRWYVEGWQELSDHEDQHNAPPAVQVPFTSALTRVGVPVTFEVTASDPDGDPIFALTAAGVPGASFTPGPFNLSGTFRWTPGVADVGSHLVTFRAANSLEGFAHQAIHVSNDNHPPVARLTATPNRGAAPLTVTADARYSSDPDGTISTHRFDFGDGTTITQAAPQASHTYPAGTWRLTLTVTDDRGATATTSAVVISEPPNAAPTAGLVVRPASGDAPLAVLADGSASRDPDGVISTYRFDFGDGASVSQTTPSVTHAYAAGTWTLTLTVTDDRGGTGTATAVITVTEPAPPPGSGPREIVAQLLSCWRSRDIVRYRELFTDDFAFTFAATDGARPPWGREDELASATHLFVGGGALPPPPTLAVEFTSEWQVAPDYRPGKTYPWHRMVVVPSLSLGIGSAADLSEAAGRAVFFAVRGDSAAIPHELLGMGIAPDSSLWFIEGWQELDGFQDSTNQPPTIQVPGSLAVMVGSTITFAITASDPDGDPIYSLTADGVAGGSFTPGPFNLSGTFRWTPSAADVGTRRLTIRAANALSGDATAVILVVPDTTAPANLVRNPSFESDTRNWDTYAGATLSRVEGGHDGAYAAEVSGPANTMIFGINDTPNSIKPVAGAGRRYRFTAWVRSPAAAGLARIRVTEYTIAGKHLLGTVKSSGARLTPSWQRLAVDYVTVAEGSTLDFKVRNSPRGPGETFVVDDLTAADVTDLGANDLSAAPDPTPEEDDPAPVPLPPTLHPSPMRDRAVLAFTTSRPGALRVEILDLAGRRVRRIVDEADAAPDLYWLTIDRAGEDGAPMSPGIYFYRIEASEGVRTGRFAVLQ